MLFHNYIMGSLDINLIISTYKFYLIGSYVHVMYLSIALSLLNCLQESSDKF